MEAERPWEAVFLIQENGSGDLDWDVAVERDSGDKTTDVVEREGNQG